MDVETMKAAIKSANGECEKKLAEMTEDQRKDLALKCVPELVVGAKILGGIVLKAVKNGNITDEIEKNVAHFVGSLASSVQQFLGFNEEMAAHDFSTTFSVLQTVNNLCEDKKE